MATLDFLILDIQMLSSYKLPAFDLYDVCMYACICDRAIIIGQWGAVIRTQLSLSTPCVGKQSTNCNCLVCTVR